MIILSISQLNYQIRTLLEEKVGIIAVEGEVSNLSRASSGHIYFVLKDAHAQLKCVYFRNYQKNLIQNNQHVIAIGQLSLYEARGEYQLIVENIKEAGLGLLHQQFETLKNKLATLGLFENSRKKKFPEFPKHIGIISSPTASALRDILITLKRRFPLAPVTLYASEVQGKNATSFLVKALEKANRDNFCDVLILARGGGSIEDLWAFNEEELIYAIAKSNIPIVSGIGHETDITLADFAADLRAATPTAAAELITPNALELLNRIKNFEINLNRNMERIILHYSQKLDLLYSKLLSLHPRALLLQNKNKLNNIKYNLINLIKNIYSNNKQKADKLCVLLDAVSPLTTLGRGYSIVTHKNKILTSYKNINKKDIINIKLAEGSLEAQITDTYDSK